MLVATAMIAFRIHSDALDSIDDFADPFASILAVCEVHVVSDSDGFLPHVPTGRR